MVAPQGTAFTGDHARILKRYVQEVVLCFDSDSAGQNAAVRVFDSLLASGLAVRVATVPKPHDPDSYIKEHGGEAFQQLIQRAEGFFDFYLNRLCATNDVQTDRGRLAVTHGMGEALQKTGSAVLLDTYAQKTALRLGVSPESLRAEFKKPGRATRFAPVEEDGPPDEFVEAEEVLAPPSEREFWLVRLLLSHDEALDWVTAHLDLNWIEHPIVRRVVAARIKLHADAAWRGVPGLMDALDDSTANELITEAVADGDLPGDVLRNLMETIRMLRNAAADRRIAALKLRLVQPGVLETEAVEILNEQNTLRRLKQQPLG